MTDTIAFIGGGNMASAILGGLVAAGHSRSGLLVVEPVPAQRALLEERFGIHACAGADAALADARLVVWAVKPQLFAAAAAPCRPYVGHALQVSVMAGIRSDALVAATGSERVVRTMPNTPALVGASASAFASGKSATPEDAQLVQKLFSSVGVALQVKESLLDAVTGLSGSGPAYVFLMIEALSDGGVAAGLPRDIATKLAAQTLLGSAKLLLETGQHPGALKDMVTSPGGTTIEGLHELEKAGVRGALINAVRAATEKSKKLGQG